MKIYNETILWLPKARYTVSNNGTVKATAFVLNSFSTLKMLRQRTQRALIQQTWQRSLGNQHA